MHNCRRLQRLNRGPPPHGLAVLENAGWFNLGADGYERRRPEATALYQSIAEYWPGFVERMQEQGGLPKFVREEFEITPPTPHHPPRRQNLRFVCPWCRAACRRALS